MKSKRLIEALPLIVGLAALLAYLNFATDTFQFSNLLTITLAFALGPAAIFGMLEIYREFAGNKPTPLLRLAITFLVIGFALLTLMLVVQQAVVQGLPLLTEDSAPGYEVMQAGLNLVQLGIDVAFDIFYSLGLILLGLFFSRQPAFGMITGHLGSLLGLALLVLNLSTFPMPPVNEGLIDVGPYTAIWWLIIIAQSIWAERQSEQSDKSPGIEEI